MIIRNIILNSLFKKTFIFLFLTSLVILLLTPNHYKSSSKIISYKSGGNSEGLLSIASSIYNKDSADEGQVIHSPEVMIGILKSYDFQLKILDAKIDKGRYAGLTVRESLIEIQKIKKIKKETDFKLIQKLKGNISVKKDRLTSIIDIQVETLDRDLSHFLNKFIVENLEKEIINFATKITKDKIEFYNQRIMEVKKELTSSEDELVQYVIKNQGGKSESISMNVARLERIVRINSQSFTQLSSSRESLLLKLVEESSKIFQIEEPTYPHLKSRPHRSILLIILSINSFFISFIFAYLKNKDQLFEPQN